MAPTCYDPNEAEQKIIVDVTYDGGLDTTNIQLDSELEYTHYASDSLSTVSGDATTLRGEVGLLTRNIII